MSKRDDVERLFETAKGAFGHLDILVNNASVFTFGPLTQFKESDFHRQFDNNVLSTILMTQELLKYFGDGGGSIINLSSISSVNPVPNSVVLFRNQKRDRRHHQSAGSRTRSAKNSRQRGRAGYDGDRGSGDDGRRRRCRQDDRRGSADGSHRAARRHCRGVLFLASDRSNWVTGNALRPRADSAEREARDRPGRSTPLGDDELFGFTLRALGQPARMRRNHATSPFGRASARFPCFQSSSRNDRLSGTNRDCLRDRVDIPQIQCSIRPHKYVDAQRGVLVVDGAKNPVLCAI